jgi:hypothetical protein
MTSAEALQRLAGTERQELGLLPLHHRVRTCADPSGCGAWEDTTTPTPRLGIQQGSVYVQHDLSATWVAALVLSAGAPAFSFGLTVTPDPLGSPGTEWSNIVCLYPPRGGECELERRAATDGVWLGDHLWPYTRSVDERNAPTWQLPEQAEGDSFRATATCVRLRLTVTLGNEEHALVFAGSY